MKIFSIVIIFNVITSLTAFGQTIETYNGPYLNGTAVYQYYENSNYERIFQGSFSYKGFQYSIAGKYNNGMMDGLWKVTNTYEDYHLGTFGSRNLIVEEVSANYQNGNLHGICRYTKTNKTLNKQLTKSIANFKNGIIIGNYVYEGIGRLNNEHYSINIFLNKEGILDSTSIIKFKDDEYNSQYEDILKFKNGFLYWELKRDPRDGEIYKKIDRIDFIEKFRTNFDTTNKVAILNNIKFHYKYVPNMITKKKREYMASNNMVDVENTFYNYRKQIGDTNYYNKIALSYVSSSIDRLDINSGELIYAILFWQKNSDTSENSDNPLFNFDKNRDTHMLFKFYDIVNIIDYFNDEGNTHVY